MQEIEINKYRPNNFCWLKMNFTIISEIRVYSSFSFLSISIRNCENANVGIWKFEKWRVAFFFLCEKKKDYF